MADNGKPVLYVLPPSHFCERARWALQHADIPFDEERWAVGLHVRLARRIAPATSLPILALGDKVIQGSGAIVDWTGMAGGDAELEARLESGLGRLVRRLAYARTLTSQSAAIRGRLMDGVPWRQRAIATLAWPVTRKIMIRAMDARPELAPQIEDEVARELNWLEARLGGKRHLVGDTFGRADLTAASLMSPMIGSPGMASRKRGPTGVFTRFEDRPALAWARGIYADYRQLRRA